MKWLLVLTVAALGCGESAPPTVTDGTSGSPAGNLNGTGGDGGAGGTGGAGGAGGAEPKGTCDNGSDLDAIEAARSSLRDVARNCGRTFACGTNVGNSTSYADCVTTCVEDNVEGLSADCAACYGGLEGCGLSAFCRPRCETNTCSVPCLDCLNDAGRITDFEACRGLPGDSCTV